MNEEVVYLSCGCSIRENEYFSCKNHSLANLITRILIYPEGEEIAPPKWLYCPVCSETTRHLHKISSENRDIFSCDRCSCSLEIVLEEKGDKNGKKK